MKKVYLRGKNYNWELFEYEQLSNLKSIHEFIKACNRLQLVEIDIDIDKCKDMGHHVFSITIDDAKRIMDKIGVKPRQKIKKPHQDKNVQRFHRKSRW